jgi:hypothetical protein
LQGHRQPCLTEQKPQPEPSSHLTAAQPLLPPLLLLLHSVVAPQWQQLLPCQQSLLLLLWLPAQTCAFGHASWAAVLARQQLLQG